MSSNCNIIKDLLPLYVDGVLSEDSKAFVEEHISSCPDCAEMKNRLSFFPQEEELKNEKKTVLEKESRLLRKKSFTVGLIISCVLLVPVIVCLIVNIASGSPLDWFFIVLISLLMVASVTVLPLMIPKCKFISALGGFTLCLMLLFGALSAMSKMEAFLIVSSASLFGISVLMLPFAVHKEPLKTALGRHKALFTLGVDTLLYAVMMLMIGISVDTIEFAELSFFISLPVLLLIWIPFLIIRYLKLNGFIKTGITITAIAIILYFLDPFMGLIIETDYEKITTFFRLIPLTVNLTVALIFTAIGIVKQIKTRKDKRI